MINPSEITNFNRTTGELEEFLLFCIVVAGKNSEVQAKKLDTFLRFDASLSKAYNPASPFEVIKSRMSAIETEYKQGVGAFIPIAEQDWVDITLQRVAMGQYSRISKAFKTLATSRLNLRTCSVSDLEAICGIGPKTARFFILHTREGVGNIAVLDTHILRWLRTKGYDAPKVTPSGSRYLKFEKIFISEALKEGKSIAELDLDIWKRFSGKEDA